MSTRSSIAGAATNLPTTRIIRRSGRSPPIELTEKITAPVLGIYGNDDKNPSPEDVNKTEERLKKAGKNYEFHRYDGAGHGFFNAPRPAYRPEQAEDAWKKVFAFFEKHLSR